MKGELKINKVEHPQLPTVLSLNPGYLSGNGICRTESQCRSDLNLGFTKHHAITFYYAITLRTVRRQFFANLEITPIITEQHHDHVPASHVAEVVSAA